MIEGFDYIPTGTGSTYNLMMAGQWYPRGSVFGSLSQTISSTTAFGYGCSYSEDRTYAQTFNPQRWVYPVGTQTEGYMGCRVWVGSAHNGYGYLVFFDGDAEVGQIYISWEDYGKIKVYRDEPPTGGGGILLGSSDLGAYYYDKWFYLEVFCKMGQTDGEVEVRINTVTVISLVNVDTCYSANVQFDCVGFGAPGSIGNTGSWRNQWMIDDLYFCDPAGSINNGFLGNVRVMCQLPVSDGSVIDFAIGGSAPAATNWQSVLTTALNDTKYVASSTIGDKDLYNVQAIINSPLVHGVQVKIAAKMDDATQRGLAAVIKSGGVEVDGITHYINQSYSFYRTIHELDPATGVGWTGAAVNLIEIGPKVVS
jgi:hypothetical protein